MDALLTSASLVRDPRDEFKIWDNLKVGALNHAVLFVPLRFLLKFLAVICRLTCCFQTNSTLTEHYNIATLKEHYNIATYTTMLLLSVSTVTMLFLQ